jgi:hypothetical protein
MATSLINVFFDHKHNSNKSVAVQVPETSAHAVINEFWDALGDDYRVESDCWCVEICQRHEHIFDAPVSFELVAGDRLYGVAVEQDRVTGHVMVDTDAGLYFIPLAALTANCACGNPWSLCHPEA